MPRKKRVDIDDSLMLTKVAAKTLIDRAALHQLATKLYAVTNTPYGTIQGMAAMLIARQYDEFEVAEFLELDLNQIQAWQKNKDFQNSVQAIREAIVDNPMLVFDVMVPKAMKTLDKALDCGDAKVELAAANSLLDRKYGKAVQKQISIESHNYNFTITSNESPNKTFIQQDLPQLPESIIEGEVVCRD